MTRVARVLTAKNKKEQGDILVYFTLVFLPSSRWVCVYVSYIMQIICTSFQFW